MPSGPKKRRASKRKKGGGIGNADEGEEENHESFGDQKAVDDIGSKESQSVDIQTGLKENVKEFVDKSESVGNKESESELVDRIIRLEVPLIQPSRSKNPQENECAQVGDGMKEVSMEVVNTTVDQSMLNVIPLNEAQDSSVSVTSMSEMNVATDGQESLGRSSLVDVFPVEDHCPPPEMANHDVLVGEDMSIEAVLHQDSSIETPSHAPQETVKIDVQSVLNKEEGEDPSDVIEVDDVETIISFEDAPESFQTPLGSPSLGYMSPIVEEGDVLPLKVNWIEAIEGKKRVDELGSQVILLKEAESVDIQDSFIDDVPPVEGVEFSEVGESTGGHVESVLKEDGDKSMEAPTELQAVVKSVYKWVLKVIPSTEDPSVPVESLSEESSIKDVQDYFKEPLDDVESFGVTQSVEVGESRLPDQGAMVNPVESVMKEDEEMSMKDVDLTMVVKKTVDQAAILLKEAEEEACVQDKSVIVETSFKDSSKLEQPLESNYNVHLNGYEIEPIESCSNETQANHHDVLKEIPSEEAQEAESVIEPSLKDAQDSLKEELGDSSMDDVSHVEETEVGESETLIKPFELGMEEDEEISIDKGVVEEPIGDDQPRETVKSVNRSVSEVNVDKSFKDGQESFGSYFMVDVEGVVDGNKCCEVDEKVILDSPTIVKHVESVMKGDKEISMNGVTEEPYEEPIARSSDPPQSIIKAVDQDTCVEVESVIEVDIEAFLKDADQDFSKEQLGDSSIVDRSPVEGTEFTDMVHHFESVKKEDEEMSIEGVREEESNVGSSDEQHIMVKTTDEKEIPLKEAQDTSVSIIEENINGGVVQGNGFIDVGESVYHHGPPTIVNYVDSILKEDEDMSMESSVLEQPFHEDNGLSSSEAKYVQDSSNEPLGSSSLVEGVNNVESAMKEEMFMKGQDSFRKSMGGSSLDDVSPGQWNEMVGLAKTLLEEIRRIREFYEEGLRQTTQIHLHICQVLEKFDSGELI